MLCICSAPSIAHEELLVAHSQRISHDPADGPHRLQERLILHQVPQCDSLGDMRADVELTWAGCHQSSKPAVRTLQTRWEWQASFGGGLPLCASSRTRNRTLCSPHRILRPPSPPIGPLPEPQQRLQHRPLLIRHLSASSHPDSGDCQRHSLYSRYSAEITSKNAPSAIYETGSSPTGVTTSAGEDRAQIRAERHSAGKFQIHRSRELLDG